MKPAIAVAALLTVPVFALAGVNLQNTNFFISYQDITQQSNGRELNLKRTYNSLSTAVGWFGFGWGSHFETRLIAMPDGSVAIQTNGTGRINYYRADENADIQGGVARIVDAATQRDKLSPDAAAALRQKLVGDEALRVRTVLKYEIQADLPANKVLRSNECPAAALVRVADRYKRVNCDKGNDYFDLQGRLIREEHSDGYSVDIVYEGKRPVKIKDTSGQGLNLKWTSADLLADATSNGRDHIIYSQDQHDNLIAVNDVNGNRYDYEYDGGHNMTRIGYIDGSSMHIQYASAETGYVTSVTERNGDKTTYARRVDPKDPQHTWTVVTQIPASGQQSSREYEYQNRTSDTGADQLARFATRDNRNKLETTYDNKSRVVRKVNAAGEFSDYVYHPKSDKLILVLSNDLKTEFHYDAKGELTQAVNSNGQVIDLDYGSSSSSNIERMVESNRNENTRRELLFKYNAAGKPTEITLVGVGKISVEYDDKGEISKVDSKQGMKMALEVTQVFQNLLSVVNVASRRF